MKIEVEEISKDRLSKKEWVFWLTDRGGQWELLLDSFTTLKRETTRHKFKWSFGQQRYNRLTGRHNNMALSEVEVPNWVLKHAKDKLIVRVKMLKVKGLKL